MTCKALFSRAMYIEYVLYIIPRKHGDERAGENVTYMDLECLLINPSIYVFSFLNKNLVCFLLK